MEPIIQIVARKVKMPLIPINNIYFINLDGIKELSPDEITIGLVGEKAYGLSCYIFRLFKI